MKLYGPRHRFTSATAAVVCYYGDMDSAAHFYAKDRQAWLEWLEAHHQTAKSVWVVFTKGKAAKLSYEDIVEVALCYGWVDSRPGKVDDTKTKLYLSQRNPRSAWSKSNKLRIKKLTAQKMMRPAGLQAVKIAKQNGAWDALNLSDNLTMPTEMAALLDRNPVAKSHYQNFSASSKRIILEWIYSAKREETKRRRIQETVALAQQGLKAHHQRQ